MAFSKEIKDEIERYCNNHLAEDTWYENEFSFIADMQLKKRIIAEFKAIRFAYKLYEGIEATDENLIFEVRNQIIAYASIYEAVIEYVLYDYYWDTEEVDSLIHHTVLKRISIPERQRELLQKALVHDGKVIEPCYYDRKKKDKPDIRFDEKCRTAEKLGLIHTFVDKEGNEVNLLNEIIEIYSNRNGIHIIAEQRKNIQYELDLSKKAYRRMKPFIAQLKEKLEADGKI